MTTTNMNNAVLGNMQEEILRNVQAELETKAEQVKQAGKGFLAKFADAVRFIFAVEDEAADNSGLSAQMKARMFL